MKFFNLFNKKSLLEPQASVAISGVRDFYSSYPTNGLTPVKLARLLKNAAEGDTRAYFEMAEEIEEKELQYATVLGTRKRTVAQLDTTVVPADDSLEAQKHADCIKEFFNRESLSNEYFDMLDAVGKGLSLMEIIWDCSENQWMPKRLQYVPPTWLDFNADLTTPLLCTEEGKVPLMQNKFIYTTIKAKSGLDIRGGLARSVSWAYMFKNYSLKDWVSFLEVYGHPYRIGKYGKNATEADKRRLLNAVYTIGADAAAVIPQDMMIEFISSESKSGGDAFQAHAEYFDRAISKAVLGQTTTTDAISGGHAVSQEHNEVRMDIANSDAKQLAKVLNEQLIKPIIDLNFGTQRLYPKISIGNPEQEDITQFADNMAKLLPYGLRVSMKQVRAKLGLDEPQDKEDELGYAPQTFAMTYQKALNKAANRLEDKDFIDDIVAEEMGQWEQLVDPLREKIDDLIRRLILEGKTLEDLKAELVKLELDPEELANSMTAASIQAQIQGNNNA